MTPEQTEKLIEMLKDYETINIFSLISTALLMVFIVIGCVYLFKKAKRMKKLLNEYKATLNEDQLKALNKWNELNK